jgi:hypothetical protein
MVEELDRDDRHASLGLQGGLMGFEYDLCPGEFADDDDWFSSSEKNPELPLRTSGTILLLRVLPVPRPSLMGPTVSLSRTQIRRPLSRRLWLLFGLQVRCKMSLYQNYMRRSNMHHRNGFIQPAWPSPWLSVLIRRPKQLRRCLLLRRPKQMRRCLLF